MNCPVSVPVSSAELSLALMVTLALLSLSLILIVALPAAAILMSSVPVSVTVTFSAPSMRVSSRVTFCSAMRFLLSHSFLCVFSYAIIFR